MLKIQRGTEYPTTYWPSRYVEAESYRYGVRVYPGGGCSIWERAQINGEWAQLCSYSRMAKVQERPRAAMILEHLERVARSLL